ncbi:MAG: dihydroneopterin aldolase [Chitinophagia bacterium]|jgi:dihydroneopterin aldolase|nr:dihydroneopterin aldolase [Chitinophagia bacterium]NCA30768.1 dihydroneopterin aldolase [Chitinophagia bacterium]NDD16073.1 dihydroneopterin aldolase [Chitinophagia bacterium]
MSNAPHLRISLDKLVFFGYHGLYAEEKKLGNNYIVDVIIDFTPKQSNIHNLEQTIDYVNVYSIIKKWMAIPTPLLETLVGNMVDDILNTEILAKKVMVKITKLHLPIDEFEGTASVSLEKSRD